MSKVLIIGDIHATDSQPLCRTDDFWKTQLTKARWFRDLWESLGRPEVIQPGDVFEKWKSSPEVISMVLREFPPMVTIPGNHDLANHRLTGYDKSALAVVGESALGWKVLTRGGDFGYSENIQVIGFPWGEEMTQGGNPRAPRAVLAHIMVTGTGVTPPPGVESATALALLKQFPDYSLIVTGHNHTPCVARDGDRILVNPGSFTRQTAAETHSPRVYLWDSDTGKLDQIDVPHDPSAITREHITLEHSRDSRIMAFVEHLDKLDVSISFRENIMTALEMESEMSPEIRQLILTSIGATQ